MLRWWNKLSAKLPVLIMLLAVGPICLFGFTALTQIKHALMKTLQERNLELLKRTIHLSDTALDNVRKTLLLAVNLQEVDQMTPMDQEWAFQLLLKELPEIYAITLYNAEGDERVKISREKVYMRQELTKHSQAPEFLETVKGAAYFGSVETSIAGTRRVTIAIPLKTAGQNKSSGVLAAEISIRNLLDMITSITIGEKGHVFVTEKVIFSYCHGGFSRGAGGIDAIAFGEIKTFLRGLQLNTGEPHV